MADLKDDIYEWLQNQGIDDCKSLRLNKALINFLKELFPNKSDDEISDKIISAVKQWGII